jgi:UPF0755 protein
MTIKRILLVFFILIFLLSVGFVVFFYKDLNTANTHQMSAEYIQIQRGSSPAEIISKLESQGVIKRSWTTLLYLRLSGRSAKLKAGDYKFASPITPLAVISQLEKGEEKLNRMTIIEGWTRWEIADEMLKMQQFKLKNREEVFALMDDTSLIRDIDTQAKNLEGYIYPDTYSFPEDFTAQQFIAMTVGRFRKEWKTEWIEQARSLNKTPREIVTIASLIETEAKLNEERPIVSSVIYNRLRINMKLGIDSAIIYASKLAGKWKNDGKVYMSDINRDSPYNTRLYAGLPPGPIASSSANSLKAALFPAQTDYLYYVRNPDRNDGAHNFYNNAADFEKGVKALRDWERQRDAKK